MNARAGLTALLVAIAVAAIACSKRAVAPGGECTIDGDCESTTVGDDCCTHCERISGTKAVIAERHRSCNEEDAGRSCPQLDCERDRAAPACVNGHCASVIRNP